MTRNHRLTRRSFLTEFTGGVTAVAIFGLAACFSDGDAASEAPSTSSGADDGATTTSSAEAQQSADAEQATTTVAEGSEAVTTGGLSWQRVNLGFVSAYVIARGSELAVVDTGSSGSEGEILNAVESLGGTWDDVNHVIATHSHGDHVGSIREVMTAASNSAGYAGADDMLRIAAPRDLVAVSDGDEVFGLQVISTPGHTPGSISVFDAGSGVLIAGDALNTPNGVVEGPNPDFSADLDFANVSVQKLAELNFETLLVGHGEPVETGAGAMVAALAESL